ncbi:MAG: helix-turn-helix transcriptional regulator [Cyanobacteria bacterium P01_D01_bin.115]
MSQEERRDVKWLFGRAVRRRRREMDWSQEELAERADLHRNYISDIERGDRNPSLENVHKLAKALGISVSELFRNYRIDDAE